MEKIFISYSHKDHKYKDQLEKHLKVAENAGHLKTWCDNDIRPGEDWLPEIKKNLNEAKVIIMLVSANFLTSEFITHQEIPLILEKRKENGATVIPLLIESCAWEKVEWLNRMQRFPKDGKSLNMMNKPERDDVLKKLTLKITEILKMKRPDYRKIQPGPADAEISKMPTTDVSEFSGRGEELKTLDEAWKDKNTRIFIFKAMGGAGKTAIINKWLDNMRSDNFRGAEKVYAWSFYSQGTEEKEQTTADSFFHETLRWFGDKAPSNGSPTEKANRLIELLRLQKTLLILDGVETLLYSPNDSIIKKGRIKNEGMRIFLMKLIDSLDGLCIITSHEDILDLNISVSAVKKLNLEPLSVEDGIKFLKKLGVTGKKSDMEKAVEEYRRHALSLLLLGKYVSTQYNGDINQRDKIPTLTDDIADEKAMVSKLIAAYEKWFGNSLEINILRIMGLFDRPIDMEVIDALKNGDTIPGITDRLKNVTLPEWWKAVKNLRDAGLFSDNEDEKDRNIKKMDCHPLIRGYFKTSFKPKFQEEWKEANKRLYFYYKTLPLKHSPNKLKELEPLYQAVIHGTRAGLYQEALTDVYYEKILRGNEYYSTDKLAAFETDLSAITNFFVNPWIEVSPDLNENEKAWVFSLAAFRLRAIGRLSEAITPWQEALEICSKNRDWENSASNAINLSELKLILGDVKSAVEYGSLGNEYASRIKDKSIKIHSLTTLADALHQNGKMDQAEKKFHEAEMLQGELSNSKLYEFSKLYGVNGFQYCDLLLGMGQYEDVITRAEETIKIAEKNNWVLELGLDNLTLGFALMQKYTKKETGNLKMALEYLDQAVLNIQNSGRQYYLPRALLARAACYRLQAKNENAWADLLKAKEIIDIGNMKLYLCDYHIEAYRLSEQEGFLENSSENYSAAKNSMIEAQYLRRQTELEEILQKQDE